MAARQAARLPPGRAEPDRLPLPAQEVGGGGRQAIHLLLLQRNGAARAPAHLSSASFADNGHLSSLSSAPMSSALLTGGGVACMSTGAHTGTWTCWTHAHVHMYRHTGHEGARQTWGDTCPCVWIKDPWRRTHMQTHSEQPHLSSRYSQLEILFPSRGDVCWGEGLVFVVNGSLSAGGPLPTPCMHTCDISHQHLLSPL